MNIYKSVELCDVEQPIANLDKILPYSEMTKFERSFLCGLIKEKQPKRILEIGMAAGATTVVILNCIQQLGLQTELISVDYARRYYKDPGKQTGFIAEEFKSASTFAYSHKCCLGDVIPGFIEEICAKDTGPIDFLVLDTMHVLPGEILDFLVCLPFLAEDATVVLHDVALNHVLTRDPAAIATSVLFSTVSGEKYYMIDDSNCSGISNIAAFQVAPETKKNIQDVFFALSITWQYCPENEELDKYRNIISLYHGDCFAEYFDRIVKLQTIAVFEKEIKAHCDKDLLLLNEQWRQAQNTFIYGCGFWGYRYYHYAMSRSLPVAGMVVSDDQIISEETRKKFAVPVFHLSELDTCWPCSFVLAISKELRKECRDNLLKHGFSEVL